MNAYLNYLLEASIGLCMFLLVYHLLLRKETNFRLNRIFLLIAILASVTFPLVKLTSIASPVPSLNFSIPETEQLTPTPNELISTAVEPTVDIWQIIAYFYVAGLLIYFVLLIVRLTKIINVVKQSPRYKYNTQNIVVLKDNQFSFSFFNYIFIGNSSSITDREREQILAHEAIHSRLYHSIDILLVNTLGIIFWFNPIIRFYKKTFVQLHEFEADARAVEKHDVDEYCSLVAKVALHSADLRLVNHFSNSLTIKRIEMMRTLKRKINKWKIIATAMVIPIFFFVVACQEQVEENQSEEIVEQKVNYPDAVQQTLDQLKKQYPQDAFIVVGPMKNLPDNTKQEEGKSMTWEVNGETYSADVFHVVYYDKWKEKPFYQILQKKKSTSVEPVQDEEREVPAGEKVFLVVEEPPTYPGGIDKISEFINQNLQYPKGAVKENIEGSVFISFIVEETGTISEANIIKGINKECDQEALRVVKLMDKWNPGMQSGKAVRVKFILPVKFKR